MKQSKSGYKAKVYWIFGLSGSGKSSIADAVEDHLFHREYKTAILDGDSIRTGLCSDLGFEQPDRQENIRRVAETAKLFANNGVITLCCFITPLNKQREMVEAILKEDLKLIFVNAKVESCEKRDVKGLYQKARNGEIPNFTGVSSQFELPTYTDLTLDSELYSIKENAKSLSNFIIKTTKIK